MDQVKNSFNIVNFLELIVRELPLLFVILISIIYSSFWSLITVDKYFALNQPVADLGDAMESIWLTVHNSFNLTQVFSNFMGSAGPYYLFWLSNYKSMGIFLLIFQSSFLGFSAVPLFLIARKELRNELHAVIISIIFLIYFPLSGINWFTFHFQAMFIPLFFSGFYFYIRKMNKVSFLILLMAGMVKFPFIIFITIFALIEILLKYKDNRHKCTLKIFIRIEKYLIILFILSILILIFGYLLIIKNNLTVATYVHSSTIGLNIYFSTAYNKFVTILFIFSPFAFLPLLSKKWLPSYLPFIALLLYSNSNIFIFPVIFQVQYMSMIIPFIFLGLIDSLKRFPNSHFNKGKDIKNFKAIKSSETNIFQRGKVTVAIFISVLLFSVFFQPYSPLNSYTPDNFSFSEQTTYNMTQYNYLMEEANLIPITNPYVLMQNNMPQLLPRFLDYNNTALTVGLTAFSPNISFNEVFANSFPRNIIGDKWTNVKIDYALGDGYTPNYFLAHYPGSPSTLTFLNVLYGSGIYGIYAQMGSVVLLKRNYSGAPLLYAPYNIKYDVNQYQNLISNATYNNCEYTYSSVAYHSLFKTNQNFFPPGVYNLSIDISTSSIFSKNNLSLSVVRSGYSGIWDTFNITSRDFQTEGVMKTITFRLIVNNFYNFLYFEPYVNVWRGMLTIGSINVKEVSAI